MSLSSYLLIRYYDYTYNLRNQWAAIDPSCHAAYCLSSQQQSLKTINTICQRLTQIWPSPGNSKTIKLAVSPCVSKRAKFFLAYHYAPDVQDILFSCKDFFQILTTSRQPRYKPYSRAQNVILYIAYCPNMQGPFRLLYPVDIDHNAYVFVNDILRFSWQ